MGTKTPPWTGKMINLSSNTDKDSDQARHRHSQHDALFAEILNNDVIDRDARLPHAISLPKRIEQLAASFELSRELWYQGLDRRILVALTKTLVRDCRIGPDESLTFKHARARFKHLRFAFATFGDRHRYPILFDALTSVMGNLQDAFKNNKHAATRRNAMLLRLLLSETLFNLVIAQTGAFRPTTPDKFREYMKSQAIKISHFLKNQRTTAQEFHDTRKIVSLYRASFATLVTLEPSAHLVQVASYVATINGMMGSFHDGLMARKLSGTLDYKRDTFVLPEEMRIRLQQLASTMADNVTQ